jgi:hypothetical protein
MALMSFLHKLPEKPEPRKIHLLLNEKNQKGTNSEFIHEILYFKREW